MTSTRNDVGSQGSHPHADRPNWRPAETAEDYLRNCREGIEKYSDRRFARLMGVPRIALYRWQMMADIPDSLFERLLACRPMPATSPRSSVAGTAALLSECGLAWAARSPPS